MKQMITLLMVLGLGIAIGVSASNTNASAQQTDIALEGESLQALLEQTKVLHSIVDQAEQSADDTARTTFNYAALRADIQTIELGVQQYIAGIRDQPRRIEPIGGEYRR